MLRERRGEAFDAEAVDALDRALAPRPPRVAIQV
jgi:hypothetical protein